MNFCLSKNQSLDILAKADQILYNESIKTINKSFLNFLKENNKILILEISNKTITDLNLILKIQKEENINIVLKLFDLTYIPLVNKLNLKWFYFLPVKTYSDLNWLCGKGPSYIYIDPPLSFDFANVKNIIFSYVSNCNLPIKIRSIPNKPNFNQYFSFSDPKFYFYKNFWFRPEDIPLYNKYIDTIDFIESNINREKELFSLYQNQSFNGLLSFIIQSFDTGINNKLISEKLIKKRLNCKQKCLSSKNNCDDCIIFLDLAKIKYKRTND